MSAEAQTSLPFFESDDEISPAAAWEQDANKRFLDELFVNVATYRATSEYKNLLEFVSRFHFYAPFNAMLVHVQKPGSRYVLPAHKWRRDYNRTIRPGAQPLVILQPFGPVMFVFDVSETEGGKLPDDVEDPFRVRSGTVGAQLSRTVENAVRDGVRISQVPHGSERAGSIGPTKVKGLRIPFRKVESVEVRYEMLLNSNHSETVRYATLAHELGHLYCGHIGTPNDKWWPDRLGLTSEVREFEAESVAYLVCKRAGIEPPSDQYLSRYLKKDGEVPSISLERVLTAAGLIEQMGRENLKLRK